MEIIHNLEAAHWIGSHRNLLLLRGWAILRNGSPVAAIRLSLAGGTVAGYHGISRPDVAKAHGGNPAGVFSGFSLLARLEPRDLPGTLEAETQDGTWRAFSSITPERITGESPVAPIESEAAGWNEAPDPREVAAQKPVLFISHDFAAAGAQLLLVRQLAWLKRHSPFPLETLIAVPRSTTGRSSAAEQDVLAGFQAAGPVHFISDLTHAPENLAAIRRGCYRLVYANTGTLGWLLPALGRLPCPVISHIHELGFWLERRTGLAVFARQAARTDRYIACSTAVRDYLTGRPGVPVGKIAVIHASGSTPQARQIRAEHTKEGLRAAMDIPDGAFVVTACGTFDWRKGAELFLPICVALQRMLGPRELRAYWIGGYGDEIIRDQFNHEAESAGLAGKATLLGHQPDRLRWMFAADCLALPSREDPFPMVMLEAGALGLPIVGFVGSGGVTEFVGTEAGLLVPFLDVEAFAAALHQLAIDPARALALGQGAERRSSGLYEDGTSFRKIAALIRELDALPSRPTAYGR